MLRSLLRHQFLALLRSPTLDRKIVSNILLGVLVLLIALQLLGIGLFMEGLLEGIAPGREPLPLINGALVYWFAVDLLLRFLWQKVPGQNVRPYLHLPVPRSRVVHFILAKSVGSLFNFLPLLVAAPVALTIVAADSASSAWVWLAAIFLWQLFNGYVAVYLKKQAVLGARVVVGFAAALVVVGLADYLGEVSLAGLSEAAIGGLLQSPFLLLFPAAALAGAYWLNYRSLGSHLYLDEIGRGQEATTGSVGGLAWLARFGQLGELLALELRLILRTRRLKSSLLMTPLVMVIGLLFYSLEEFHEYDVLMIYLGTFFTGMFMINYGQFLFSWEGSYFDGLIARSIDPRAYLKAKLTVMVLGCLSHYVLLLPLAYFGRQILFVNTAMCLFNIGVSAFLLMLKATFNRQRVELNVSAFSMQGKDSKQILTVMLLVLLPLAIYFPFMRAEAGGAGLVAIGSVGVLGILLYRFQLDALVALFKRQKYALAAGLRHV